jgi:hypothetical protein
MSRDLNLLESSFRAKAQELLAVCQERGHILRPFFTLRDPWVQAELWRQSRAWPEIEREIQVMRDQGAEWLAQTLEDVGSRYGKWATNALPGLSWHNHGLALDCFVLENGKAVWDDGHPGYGVYAESAKDLGLVSGHYWQSRDSVHVQGALGSVRKSYSWLMIDKKMQKEFRNARDN